MHTEIYDAMNYYMVKYSQSPPFIRKKTRRDKENKVPGRQSGLSK